MARKRMFDKEIIIQDKFLDLAMETKALYFLLGMEADDEGFVSPKKVMRLYGGTVESLRSLAQQGFIIPFESGVVVITDWKQNNYLDSKRIQPTLYQDEKSQLVFNTKTQKYELAANVDFSNVKQMLNNGLTNAKQMFGENRIEENSIEENSIVQNSILESKSSTKTKKFIPPTLDEIKEYCIKRNNNIDPKVFYDYYNTGNWIDAKGNKVKNWKQKIITWERQSPKQRKDNSGWDYIDEEINAIRQDWVEAKCNETK